MPEFKCEDCGVNRITPYRDDMLCYVCGPVHDVSTGRLYLPSDRLADLHAARFQLRARARFAALSEVPAVIRGLGA